METRARGISRRGLLRTALSVAAVPHFVRATALGGGDRPPPSRRVAMGFVGLGSHGVGVNLRNALAQKDAQVVAMCDCDAGRLKAARRYAPDARVFADWSELVARDDIDAVVVSTPDHWHVPISIAAVKSGKDVLCEKPLTLTVAEGRALSDALKRYNRIFQTGSEFRGKRVFHRAAELVRNGRIGRLHTMRIALGSSPDRPGDPGPMPVPPGFDYNMWLGPAPWAPYTVDRCHYNYRWILDYSGGRIADWGGHLFDQAQWTNDTEGTGPVEIQGKGRFLSEGLFNTAVDFRVEYTYANGVKLITTEDDPIVGTTGAIRYEGDAGWITATYPSTLKTSSQKILKSVIGPGETHLYTCAGLEMRNFLDCVASRKTTYYPAETGHRSATLAHLGNIAMLTGCKLRWDPGRERFVDNEAANRMLARAMRAPWSL